MDKSLALALRELRSLVRADLAQSDLGLLAINIKNQMLTNINSRFRVGDRVTFDAEDWIPSEDCQACDGCGMIDRILGEGQPSQPELCWSDKHRRLSLGTISDAIFYGENSQSYQFVIVFDNSPDTIDQELFYESEIEPLKKEAHNGQKSD